MNKDWQNALQSLLDEGGLPEGDSAVNVAQIETKKQTGKLVVSMEKKGRAGKTATIVSGFTVEADELNDIASKLKAKLATGGSARGGEILIQGDRRDEVKRLLSQMGFKV